MTKLYLLLPLILSLGFNNGNLTLTQSCLMGVVILVLPVLGEVEEEFWGN